MPSEQTLGQRRVRAGFNPSSNTLVDEIKNKTAELIDLCNNSHHDRPPNGEEARLWSLAMTHYEDASMWAVKAVTMPPTRFKQESTAEKA